MAMFETRRIAPRNPRMGLLVAAGIVALAWSAWIAAASRSGETAGAPGSETTLRQPNAGAMDRVTVSAELVDAQLVATRALTDFGVDVPVRFVAVRILSSVDIEVRIHAKANIVLASYPHLCLIGPFSMPDYAGLTEPCWGEPDLGMLLRAHLATDPEGRPTLLAGTTVTLRARLHRDTDRCDYPPGHWRLELEIEPVREGAVRRRVDIVPVALALSPESAGPLPLVKRTNYCGIANVVFREQGEPAIVAADPDGP